MSASLNGLAAVDCQKGKVSDAEPLYRRSLSLIEKADAELKQREREAHERSATAHDTHHGETEGRNRIQL